MLFGIARLSMMSMTTSRRRWLCLVTAVLPLIACTDDRDHSLFSPARGPASPMEAAVQVRVVGCRSIEHLGQGSVIGPRLVLTSAHVVAGATAIELTTADGSVASGTVVHLDPDLDLALVEIDHQLGRPLAIGRADRGDTGTIVVRREDQLQPMQVGVVRPVTIRTEDIYIQGHVMRPGYELDATIEPGDSGAVVVVDGQAVAVVWSRSRQNESRAWAIDPNAIADAISGTGRLVPADTHCV